MKTTKLFICIVAIVLIASDAFSQDKPNFVIIFADDMGYGDASCYGHPTIMTPHIDRMAEEGMRMTQFYVASSVCSPSRASLLTGRLPNRCSVTGVLFPRHETGLPKDEITIARMLKQEGYATACIGKWHLGHKSGYLPTDHGFDQYYGIPYSNDMYIDPEAPLAEDILLREGVTIEEIRANEYYRHNPKYVPLMRQEEVIEFPADQSTLTRRYTEEAVAFIQSHRNESFFLYLAHTMPHTPLYVSDDFRNTSLRGLYGDVIEELDWSVGRILSTLRDAGLDSKTLVIFSSDNGPWLIKKLHGGSTGPLHGGKFTSWEGGQREPGIFWWPGTVPEGSVNTGLSGTLDILPTILDFAGSKLPDDRIMDGYSLREMLTDQAQSPRKAFFYYKGKNLQAIRSGPWKAHYRTTNEFGKNPVEHDPPLLFNLEEDPGEKYDVANENPEILEAIQKLRIKHEKSFH
jgi:arylsulfatase A-like enzyme